jgi:competence protein ComFC
MCNRSAWNRLTHPACVRRQGIDGSFAALSYNGVVKRLLFSFKYRPYVSDLRKLLGELFYEGIIQNEQFMKRVGDNSVFMPIPLHTEKMRKRGYNHAELLAGEIGDKMSKEVVDKIIRTRKTKSQFLLKKEEREENVKNAFALPEEDIASIKNRKIFLIDDVVTTGSTLKEVAKILKKSGAKEVYGLTLAHGH